MVAADHQPLQVVGLPARAVQLGAVGLEDEPQRVELDAALVVQVVALTQPLLALRGALAQRVDLLGEHVDLGVLLEQLLHILEQRRRLL